MLVVLAVIFLHRKFYKDFLFFFAYISFAPVATVARIFVRNQPWPYFIVYWSTEAVFAILALFTLNEVFKRMFDLDYAQRWWFRFILPVLAVIIAILFLGQPLRPTSGGRFANAVFSFDLGVHFLQGAFLVLFLAFEKILGASYDQYEQGIIGGFGISAAVTILTDLLRAHGGSRYTVLFTYAPPAAYILAAIIWLRAFVKEPSQRQRLPISISELIELLKRQGEIADRINRKWKLWRLQT
jgi:hypothetical protein